MNNTATSPATAGPASPTFDAPDGSDIEYRFIDPEWAATMLATQNDHNRPLSQAHVNKLIREINDGRWVPNGETVKISKTGKLLDGQHRLAAVVQTQTGVWSYVAKDLDDEVFKFLGTAVKPRSVADMLHIGGIENGRELASAGRLVDRYKTKRMGAKVDYRHSDFLDIVERYPGLRDSVVKVIENRKKKFLPASVLAACHYIFAEQDRALADSVFSQVVDGAGYEPGSPMHLFRERLIQDKDAKARLKPDYIMALFIKAWNSTRRGETVKYLRYRERGENAEAFPEAV